MKQLILPPYLCQVIELLGQAGRQAYLVGGAVRDLLRGAVPQDFDLATDAVPAEVAALLKQAGLQVVENLGQNFGVVLALVAGQAVEIGTFRRESYGKDAHRPERVEFSQSLTEDLARRDFTVNAMALDPGGKLFDPFGGQADLAAKILRTVGEAGKRFSEDGLRMYRACRFAAQLDFKLEQATFQALRNKLPRAEGLSSERVKKELELLLCAKQVDKGLSYLKSTGLAGQKMSSKAAGQTCLVPVLPELLAVAESKLASLSKLPGKLPLRWAGLLYLLGPALPGSGTENILARFGYPAKMRRRIGWLAANLASPAFPPAWLLTEARSSRFKDNRELVTALEQLEVLAAALLADRGKQAAISSLAASARDLPVHSKDLALSGQEVKVLLQSEEIGTVLQGLLLKVQAGELTNKPEVLAAFLQENKNDLATKMPPP